MPYIEIRYSDISFDPKVQTFCHNPKFKCPNYGHSWACPPEAPYLEKVVSSFRKFYLVYYQFDLKSYVKQIKANHPKRKEEKILGSFYAKALMRDYLETELLSFIDEYQEDYEERLVLWDGYCRVCNNPKDKYCTYDSGKPCRYPDKKRYSMEAVGINVNDTVKNLQIELEWPPLNYAYRFGLVCFK